MTGLTVLGCVDEADLKLTEVYCLPLPPSPVLGLKVYVHQHVPRVSFEAHLSIPNSSAFLEGNRTSFMIYSSRSVCPQ